MSKVQMQGLLATGYGIVPKTVMRDVDLSIEAKAIYAYLTTFADGTGQAFPSVDLVCHDLDISRQRFNRHRKSLEDKGYITVHRERAETGFTKNVYTINTTLPKQNVTSQNITVREQDNSVQSRNVTLQNTTKQIQNENVSSQFVTSQNVTQGNVTLQNLTTNNTSLKSTSINNTNINNNDDVNIFNFYQENGFGILTPYIAQRIGYWVDETNPELVLYALKISAENNVAKWNYAEKILTNWEQRKLLTIDQVVATERQRQMQQAHRKPFGKPQREEQLPEWFGQEKEQDVKEKQFDAEAERLRQQLLNDFNKKKAEEEE